MKTRIFKTTIILILIFALGACGRDDKAENAEPSTSPTSTISASSPQIEPTRVNLATTQAQISSFMPVADVQEGEIQATGFGDVESFPATLENGDLARFQTQAETGQVIGFVRLSQSPKSINISEEEAQGIAKVFVLEHEPEFNSHDLDLVYSGLTDDEQDGSNYYLYWWLKVDPVSGAFLPNEARVRVNAETGLVDSYSRINVDVEVPTEPNTDEDQARAIALDAVKDLAGAEIVNIALSVSTLPVYEPNGEQALLWQIVVAGSPDETGYVPGVFIVIDAMSGEIVHMDPFV